MGRLNIIHAVFDQSSIYFAWVCREDQHRSTALDSSSSTSIIDGGVKHDEVSQREGKVGFS